MRLFFAWWLLYAASCAGNEYHSHHYDYYEKSTIFLTSFGWTPFGAIFNFISDHHDGIFAGITTLATIAIAWFTATIWAVNRSQLTHSHQIERAYVSGGGAPEVEERDLGTETIVGPT